MKFFLGCLVLMAVSCTNQASDEIEKPVDMDVLNKILSEPSANNVKRVSRAEYIKALKGDFNFVKSEIFTCFEFSKKYEKRALSSADLISVQRLQSKMDLLYEKYVSEDRESNPMLTIIQNEKDSIEGDWVSLVSIAHNPCFNFGRYLPEKHKDKNKFSYDSKYLNLNVKVDLRKRVSTFESKHGGVLN